VSTQLFATVDELPKVYKSSVVAVCGRDNQLWYGIVTQSPSNQTASAKLAVEWFEIAYTTSKDAIVLQLADENPDSIPLGAVLDVVHHQQLSGDVVLVDAAEQTRLKQIGNYIILLAMQN
jgi:hypothetical protein